MPKKGRRTSENPTFDGLSQEERKVIIGLIEAFKEMKLEKEGLARSFIDCNREVDMLIARLTSGTESGAFLSDAERKRVASETRRRKEEEERRALNRRRNEERRQREAEERKQKEEEERIRLAEEERVRQENEERLRIIAEEKEQQRLAEEAERLEQEARERAQREAEEAAEKARIEAEIAEQKRLEAERLAQERAEKLARASQFVVREEINYSMISFLQNNLDEVISAFDAPAFEEPEAKEEIPSQPTYPFQVPYFIAPGIVPTQQKEGRQEMPMPPMAYMVPSSTEHGNIQQPVMFNPVGNIPFQMPKVDNESDNSQAVPNIMFQQPFLPPQQNMQQPGNLYNQRPNFGGSQMPTKQ